MTKAAYWKGERLHENLQTWRAAPTSNLGRLTGAYRLLGRANPRSRNWYNEVTVFTSVRPKAGTAHMDRQTQMNAALSQKHDSLLGISDSLGPLSWSEDDTQRADVDDSYSANAVAQAVDIGSLEGSWTPTVGHYLLCRQPSSDQTSSPGFVAAITGTGAGSVTFVVAEDIDDTWEILPVQMHYPEMAYDNYADGGSGAAGVDFLRSGPKVSYRFVGGESSRLVLAGDLQQDLS